MSQTSTGEQTDFELQVKYHQMLNKLKVQTKPEFAISNDLENEPGYRSPSTDSPREPDLTPVWNESDADDGDEEDSKRDDMLLLIDWDDTLYPTSWMTEVLQKSQNGMALVTDAEMALLDRLGGLTLNLLDSLIKKYGARNVNIVTNSLAGWIKDSLHYAACISAVYKDIEELLHRHAISMDSAQSLYRNKSSQSSTPTKWKQLCYSAILSTAPMCQSVAQSQLVTIGDQWTDHFAAKQSLQLLEGAEQSPVHHIIKLKTKPSVADMVNEMQYVQTCFTQIFDVNTSSSTTHSTNAIQPVVVDYHQEEMKYYQQSVARQLQVGK